MTKVETFLAYRIAVGSAKKRLADTIVRENMPLVLRLASRFQRKWSLFDIPLEDFHQAGAVALLRALQSYDPLKSKFSSWSGDWIRKEFQLLANHEGYKNIGKTGAVRVVKLREIQGFIVKNGRQPTAEEAGITQDQLEAIQEPAPQFDEYSDSHPENTKELFQAIPTVAGEAGVDAHVAARALGEMPELDQAIFSRFVNGESAAEISRELRLKRQLVEDVIKRVQMQLQRVLASAS